MGWSFGVIGCLLVLVGGVWIGWLSMGRPQQHRAATDLLVAAWLGWYAQGMAVLLLGWLGLLSPIWLGLLLLIPLGGLFLDRRAAGPWLRGALSDYGELLRAPWWLLVLVAVAVVWLGLQLTVPPFHYDLLTYGFGQPAHWLAEGRIAPIGPDMYAYEAVPSRMHFMLGLGLFGAKMASAGILSWVLAAGLLVARAVRTVVGTKTPWAPLALLALIITPALWDLLLLRKDDPSALWGGAALLLLYLGLSRAERFTRGHVVTLALAATATFAAKPGVTAGYVAIVLGLLWISRRADRRALWRTGMAIGALVFVALLPIAIHTWLGLGHPLAAVFPHLSRYEVTSTRWQQALLEAHPFELQPAARMLPYALSEFGRFYDFRRWNFGDNLGLFVLLGLPIALLACRRRALALIWLAGIAGWFFTFHWPRFALVLLPLEILLVMELLRRAVPHRTAVAIVAVLGLTHAWFFVSLTVTGSRMFRPSVVAAFGGDEPLTFVPPSVSICEEANARLSPADHRILFVGETRCWPCRIPFDFWNAHFRHPFERIEPGQPPEVGWERHVAERGITHVIYSPEVARKRMEWSPEMHERFERWLAANAASEPISARNDDSTTFLVTLGDVAGVAAIQSKP